MVGSMQTQLEERMEDANASPSRRPRTMRFSYFLKLFVRFRWAAALSAGAAILTTQFYLEFESFAFPWLYAVVGWILLYNSAFYFYLRGKDTSEDKRDDIDRPEFRRARLAALAQILLDLLALFALLHFAGGLTNPFVLFFLFHVVVAGTLLEARHTLGVACFTSALIFALGVLEKSGILAHYRPVEILGDTSPVDSWLFALGLPAVLTVTILALTLLITSIMNERSRRRDQIIELSEALDRKNQALVRMDHMRKQLLAVASHDLKSPIAAVATSLVSMRDGYLGPLTSDQQRVIERSLGRLARLREFIDDVLEWSSIERGTLRQEMRPVDLSDILLRVVEDQRETALTRGTHIDLSLPPKMPLVACSPERMTQVFENLASNAVKYSKDGGKVRVEARQEGPDVIISFLDNGIGISQDDLGHLFEDFFRAPSIKTKVEGTGLGLALVKRIVTAHNGEIWATSEVGLGSAFFVRLPICPADAPERVRESMAPGARQAPAQAPMTN